MKIIRSNKKGFRIHSPFVYGLVTNVLFDESKTMDFSGTEVIQPSQQVQLIQFYRLLHFFLPEKVFFSEQLSAETEKKLKDNLVCEFLYPGTIESSVEEAILNFPFVVLGESFFCRLNRFPEDNSVWFIKKELRSEAFLFQNLPECEIGRITIELKYAGIVIFSNKFHTQGYVIK